MLGCNLADSEPASEEEQSEGIFLVQCQEFKVDHSVRTRRSYSNSTCCIVVYVRVQANSVSLLGNAINQFRKHRSARMRQSLRKKVLNLFCCSQIDSSCSVVQMANEYFSAGDFRKALT